MNPLALTRTLLAGVLLLIFAAPALAEGPQLVADRLLVIKSEKRLLLFNKEEVIKIYRVALGKKDGAKVCLGDHRTPEGRYVIDHHKTNSRFYRALHISYPNPDDIMKAKRLGVSPGGNVLIHGLPKGYEDLGTVHARHNWTDGCIAVSNEEMDELWELVPDGTPIEIVP